MHKIDTVQIWLDSVALSHSGSKNTETRYRQQLDAFLKFADISTENIQRDCDLLSDKEFRLKYAREIKSFASKLMRGGYTSGSVHDYLAAVKSFFKYNDFPLGFVPAVRKRVVFHNRDISKEEIVQLLGISGPREKAFFSMMAQSGLRPTTLCMLKLKDLEPDYSKGTVPLKVNVSEEATKGQFHSYFSFLAEDSVRLLKDYLNTRKNLTRESYVFTQQGLEQPAIYNTFSSMFRKAARHLRERGLMEYEQKQKDRPAEIRLYSLRKWFRKMAIQAGFENVEYWMGHSGPGVDEAYRPKDPEFYRKIYAEKAAPFLRLETATPSETEKTIEEQARQIEDLKKKLADQATFLDNIQRDFNEVKRKLHVD
jgi:integrase